jgi:hypothetical protein
MPINHVCVVCILIESENQELSEIRGEKQTMCASFVLKIVKVIFPHRVRNK